MTCFSLFSISYELLCIKEVVINYHVRNFIVFEKYYLRTFFRSLGEYLRPKKNSRRTYPFGGRTFNLLTSIRQIRGRVIRGGSFRVQDHRLSKEMSKKSWRNS